MTTDVQEVSAADTYTATPRVRRPLGMWQWLSIGVLALMLLPVAALIYKAVGSRSENWSHLISNVLGHAAEQSLLLLIGVGVLVAALGTGTAWVVSAYQFRGRKIVEWALLLPLAVPTYIVAYCYLDILHPIGPVQSTLRWMLGYSSPLEFRLPDIRSLPGCILLLGFVLYPYVYVPVRAMFLMQAANMIEVSRTLGVSRRSVFFRVALPLARPAIAVGTSLALMETLNDIGASEFLGVRTLTVSIYSTWINRSDLAAASQIALAMLVVVFILITLERWARKNQRFSNAAQKAGRLNAAPLHGVQGLAALTFCAFPVIIGFVAPLSYLLSASFRRIGTMGLSTQLITEAINTIVLAVVSTIVTLLLGIIVSYCIRVRPGKFAKTCMRLASIGYALPGTVVAIGVLFPIAGLDNVLSNVFGVPQKLILMGSGVALIYAYAVRFLAISAGNIESGLSRVSRSLDYAARSLGETATGTFVNVHLPLTKPALAAAGLLLFVDCVKELPATLMLRPLNFETFATHLYSEAARGSYEDGAIAALLIVIIGILPLILLSRVGRALGFYPTPLAIADGN